MLHGVRLLRRHMVSYITDVEGDVAYFLRLTAAMPNLQWLRCGTTDHHHEHDDVGAAVAPVEEVVNALRTPELGPLYERFQLNMANPRDHFVYGGDAFDHGADITFARLLLSLRARHPQRVHLILGNRDANKMVMLPILTQVGRTMSGADAQHRFFHLHQRPATWKSTSISFEDFAKTHTTTTTSSSSSSADMPHEAVLFLQWALAHKLGSPNAFEHRRRELQQLRQRTSTSSDGDDVEDATVARSYLDAISPGGVYHDYLLHSRIIHQHEDLLFVHGGINAQNLGCVPRCVDEVGGAVERIDCSNGRLSEWMEELHRWKLCCVRSWQEHRDGHGGAALREYVFPRTVVPHSVAVGSNVGHDGPSYVDVSVAEALLSGGVRLVCSGHQPSGDSPAIVCQPGGLTMISADNSYCGRGGSLRNSRGEGTCVVEASVADEDGDDDDDGCTRVCVRGCTADGEAFRFDPAEHAWIGRCVGDGWWVKRWREESGTYLVSRTQDAYRHEEMRWATAEELAMLVAGRPLPSVGGELRDEFEAHELRHQHIHRIKTKVVPTRVD